MLGYVIRHLWAVFGPVSEEEEGQALTEYGLILALIAIVVIGVLVAVGAALRDQIFGPIHDCLQDPSNCTP